MNNGLAIIKTQNSKICWKGIFAGVIVTLVIGSLLNLLGIGLGLVTILDKNQSVAIDTVMIIWIGISTVIAMISGGWVVDQLMTSGTTIKAIAAIHGLVTSSIMYLVIFFLVTASAGVIISSLVQGLLLL